MPPPPKAKQQELSKNGQGACIPFPGGEKRVTPLADLPELAREPNLVEKIQGDIAALGLVGEEEAGLLLYLVSTSRLQDEPLRLLIRGSSSSGKSEISRRVVPMFPPEAVIPATSITPNALYYMPSGSLEHKLIDAGERKHKADDEAADASAALRQLISEGRISKLVTVRNEQGEFETKTIEQNGPVAVCQTTTKKLGQMFKEDVNRCVVIETDDTPDQTRKVLMGVAKRFSRSPEKKIDTQAILDRHRAFQSSLEKVNVAIPFAEALADKMPAGRIEVRRAITQVFGTIEAIALLHQHQRGRDEQGRLEATASDYALARQLLLAPLSMSIGFSDAAQLAYRKIKGKLKGQFNTTQAETVGGFTNKMSCHRLLKELEAMGVLKCIAPGRSHTPARWQWTNLALDEMILPGVESLFVTS